ncbi:DNA primase [Gordonia alkanivorans]|uniref:DNA primase n=1 Tax=Gordonia alkanivorans TaxID=84096 RepID=UPI0004B8DA1A|nr:DNA primase [Gordonia alkanivorans]
MARVPESFIANLRRQVAIADVVREHVDLAPRGALLVGLCPAHTERTPSFTVRPDLGRFKCYGCGEGGDVIDFVCLVDGLSFRESVEVLADRAHMVIPVESGAPRGPSDRAIRSALLAAQELFVEQLSTPSAQHARTFLSGRAFSREHAAEWGVGYCPGTVDVAAALRRRGHSTAVLEDAGLIKHSRSGRTYDTFRDRLTWPLHDAAGRLSGFAGRSLDPAGRAKYLNSEDSRVFHKGRTLFGLWAGRREILSARAVIVVEGYTDVMAFAAAGHRNVVATCGTAVTREHVKLISGRIGDDGEVISGFDNDDAGRKATWELFLQCQHFTSRVSAIDYSDYGEKADGCEVRTQRGDAAMSALVDALVPALQLLISQDCYLPAAAKPEDVAVAARRVRDRLRQVTSPILRQAYLEKAAEALHITVDALTAGAHSPGSAPERSVAPTRPIAEDDQTTLAALLISHPDLWERVGDVTEARTLADLFDPVLSQIVEVSWSGYRYGRPCDGEDAQTWTDFMLYAIDPAEHPRLWNVAYCDPDTSPTTLDALAMHVRRVRLHNIVEDTRSDPARSAEYMDAFAALRALKANLSVL